MEEVLKILLDEDICAHTSGDYNAIEYPEYSDEYIRKYGLLGEEKYRRYKIRQYRCSDCNTLIREEKVDRYTGKSEITDLDPIYEVLYTRKGRFKLLKYLLIKVGVERLPDCWDKHY